MTEPTPLAAFARRRAYSLPPPTGAKSSALPHWRPGRGGGAAHSELFSHSDDAAGAGLALAMALDQSRGDERAFLWVQDKAALRLSGRPYRPGLPPALRGRMIHVAAATPEDALFALEEGLRCRDLAFVVGEIAGNPRALSFTASRRLSLAAERHGTALWLIRLDAARDLSSARMRWQVAAAPSPVPRWNPDAPGRPAWHAQLFRSRAYPPGQWILSDDGQALIAAAAQHEQAHPVDLVRPAGDRSLAAG